MDQGSIVRNSRKRKNSPDWKKEFVLDAASNRYKCLHCPKDFAEHSSNLIRHLKAHEDIAMEYGLVSSEEPPNKKLKITNKSDFIRYCVDLIVLHSTTFSFFNTTAVRALLGKDISLYNVTMNGSNSLICVKKTSEQINHIISNEIAKRMISLKLDVVSRYGRSFLGINCQYYNTQQNRIIIRTLAVTELLKKHNAQYLEQVLKKTLEKYNINLRQVLAFTTDNGSNLVKLAQKMHNDQNFMLLNDFMEEYHEFEDVWYPENNEEFAELHKAVDQMDGLLVHIRCAAHVLQLSVNDLFKEILDDQSVKEKVNRLRSVVKSLKLSKYKEKMLEYEVNSPKIDVVSRWNSIYLMIESILKIKSKLLQIYNELDGMDLKAVKLDDDDWNFASLIHDALKPLYVFTLKLQSTQLSLTEFYLTFNSCKHEIKNASRSNEISKKLLAKFKERSNMFFASNDVLIAAIYCDPRFTNSEKSLLNHSLKLRAEAFLIKTIKQVQRLHGINLSQPETHEDSFENFIFDESDCSNENIESREFDFNDEILYSKVISICSTEKVSVSNGDFDILNYVQDRFKDDVIMKEAILAVLTSPATQTSVERTFSLLKIICNHLRVNLDANTINDIIVCNSNHDLFPLINFGEFI